MIFPHSRHGNPLSKREEGDSLYRFLIKELWVRFSRDDVLGWASQCSYYFLLSLFPFIIFAMSVISFLPITTKDVIANIHEYMPIGLQGKEILENSLEQILNTQHTGFLSLGFLFAWWTASTGIESIVDSINQAYEVKEHRSYIHSKLLAFLLTFGMLIVFVSLLTLSVFGHLIGEWARRHWGVPAHSFFIWNVSRTGFNLLIVFLVFLGLYYIAPNLCKTCKEVLPGAILASIGWIITSWGFSYYVVHFSRYSSFYGGIGGVIVLMTWFYLSITILVLGGEINAILYRYRKSREA